MHEAALAEGIALAVEKIAIREAVARVLAVRIAVGELAGVDIDALRFAWRSFARRPGRLNGCRLRIERPEGRAWCLDCTRSVPLHRTGDPCPECGRWHLAPVGGHELKVLDFEVPDAPPDH